MSPKEIERMSNEDEELEMVRKAIENDDWTSKDICASYKAVKNELTIFGKLVLRGTRLVIPTKLRGRFL